MPKFNKKIIIISIGTFVLISGFLVSNELNEVENVQAAASDNIGGWAWSSNVGWISFNCTNQDWCATSSYGVNVDSSTGEFSGSAWSGNLGWISFDRSKTGDPPAEPYLSGVNYIAKVSSSTMDVSGWARALAASSTAQENGGWNGWIKMSWATSTATGTVKLNNLTKEFEGWAWGGNPTEATSKGVIGWLSFNDKDYDGSPGPYDYQVTTTVTLLLPGPTTSDTYDTCLTCSNTSTPAYTDGKHPTLSWTCSATQTQRQIEIKGPAADCSTWPGSGTTWTWNSEVDSDSNPSFNSINSKTLTDKAGVDFSWNNTYCWRVKTKAAGTDWGDWAYNSGEDKKSTDNTTGFTLPVHSYPLVYFLCSYTGDKWYDCDGSGRPALSLIPSEFQSVVATTTEGETVKVASLPTAPAPNQKVYMKDVSVCYNSDNSTYACGNLYANSTFYKWNLEDMTNYNLVANYGFNDGIRYPNTTNVEDLSATNDGTFSVGTSGSTTVSEAWVDSPYGKALSFDGVDDRVSFVAKVIPLGAKSIEFWFQPKRVNVNQMILDNGWNEDTTKYGTNVLFNNGNAIVFTNSKGTSGEWNFRIGSSVLSIDTWYHIVATWDGTTNSGKVKIYINGVVNNTGTAKAAETTESTSNLNIGRSANGVNYNKMVIDAVRIYNRDLTADEVSHLYAAGPHIRAEENPSYSFQEGTWKMFLNTCDTHSPDEECEHCEEGGTRLPLPEWKEIAPY